MHVNRAYSKELSQAYDSRHFGGRSGQHIFEKDCGALDALLPPPEARVLDLPCGTGVYTSYLAQQGYAVIAADASAPMLEITKERVPGIRTELCSVHDLPFPTGAFDATLTLRLFSHFERRETGDALRELARVIRPGGVVVFDSFRWTPRRWPILRRFMAQDHIHELRPREVEALIASAGLQKVRCETRYLFSPIWQRKLPYPVLCALTAVESVLPESWLLRTFWACTKDE